MKKIVIALSLLSLAAAGNASASSKAENTGVLGGAVVGALAGGPVGAIIGATLGGHYGVVVERRNQEEARAEGLSADLTAARRDVESSRGQVSKLGGELARSRESVTRLQSEVDELLRDQALLAEMKFDVLFRTNASELGDADKAQIALLAKFMKRHPELRVRLLGHTDIRGGERFNDSLSNERARAVAGFLESLDIDAARIETVALGERNARASEGDVDGYALDRRVSVQFAIVEQESPAVAHSD